MNTGTVDAHARVYITSEGGGCGGGVQYKKKLGYDVPA